MSPTVFDFLLVGKLAKLSRIYQNVPKLVEVIKQVANQMHLNKVNIRFRIYQGHMLVILFFQVFVPAPVPLLIVRLTGLIGFDPCVAHCSLHPPWPAGV